MRTIITLSAALLIGTAAAAASKQAEMVPAGEAVTCITTMQIRNTRVVDDSTIDFILNNGTVMRNALPNRCPGLRMSEAFAYSPTASRLCNVDIITVIEQGGGPRRGASCGLGLFTPMKKAEVAPE